MQLCPAAPNVSCSLFQQSPCWSLVSSATQVFNGGECWTLKCSETWLRSSFRDNVVLSSWSNSGNAVCFHAAAVLLPCVERAASAGRSYEDGSSEPPVEFISFPLKLVFCWSRAWNTDWCSFPRLSTKSLDHIHTEIVLVLSPWKSVCPYLKGLYGS